MGRFTLALFALVCLAILYQTQAKPSPWSDGRLYQELRELERSLTKRVGEGSKNGPRPGGQGGEQKGPPGGEKGEKAEGEGSGPTGTQTGGQTGNEGGSQNGQQDSGPKAEQTGGEQGAQQGKGPDGGKQEGDKGGEQGAPEGKGKDGKQEGKGGEQGAPKGEEPKKEEGPNGKQAGSEGGDQSAQKGEGPKKDEGQTGKEAGSEAASAQEGDKLGAEGGNKGPDQGGILLGKDGAGQSAQPSDGDERVSEGDNGGAKDLLRTFIENAIKKAEAFIEQDNEKAEAAKLLNIVKNVIKELKAYLLELLDEERKAKMDKLDNEMEATMDKIDGLCKKLEEAGVRCEDEEEPTGRKKRAIGALAKHALIRRQTESGVASDDYADETLLFSVVQACEIFFLVEDLNPVDVVRDVVEEQKPLDEEYGNAGKICPYLVDYVTKFYETAKEYGVPETDVADKLRPLREELSCVNLKLQDDVLKDIARAFKEECGLELIDYRWPAMAEVGKAFDGYCDLLYSEKRAEGVLNDAILEWSSQAGAGGAKREEQGDSNDTRGIQKLLNYIREIALRKRNN